MTAGVRTRWCGVALIVASLILGVLLTMVPSAATFLAGFDRPVLRTFALTHAHSSAWAIDVAQGLSWLGSASVRSAFIFAAILVMAMRHHWRDVLLYVIVVAVTIITNTALKEVFARARPALVPWLDNPANLSYPSGHSANSMVVVLLAALLLSDRRLLIAAIAFALAVGVSRLALGVHWPTDVVGGWLFGGGAALIGYSFSRRIDRAR